ncbi:hypothetical protein E8E12_003345 [Didymella heteroderae]|uniref:Rhodopsin domain-containing protein n=1 Tax=Didymella heteroderae TaxID=1769908 RepID=A0A9P4WLC0_9PLEO|nr:hypothetical protein E8E12_003345 [Didymella heteroderae]
MDGRHATYHSTFVPMATSRARKMIEIRPPLTEVSNTNQNGVIAILTGFTLGLLLLSILVRLYVRRNTGRLHCDGYAFYLGVVLGLAEVSVTLWLVDKGMGKNTSMIGDESLGKMKSGIAATSILYLGTLCLSKISCALMLVWLTPFKAQIRAAWALVGLSGVWMVSAMLLEGLGCRDLMGQCHGYRARWVYISFLDMLIEAALVGASVFLVWNRSMSARAKFTVVGAFSCRIPNMAITLTRLVFLNTTGPTEAIHVARIQATAQLAVGYTIVSCVIPYLRPLMQSYESDDVVHGRAGSSFKLSDRSRESKCSRDLMGAKELQALNKGKAKDMSNGVGVESNDVSQLLGPARPGFVRLKSAEGVERTSRQVV